MVATFRLRIEPVTEEQVRIARQNGGEPRKRGRPSLKPKILELVRDLARFHGPGWT